MDLLLLINWLFIDLLLLIYYWFIINGFTIIN